MTTNIRTTDISIKDLTENCCPEIKKGISKAYLAKALGKRPSEITRWLSGKHNFTLRTIALLSDFFEEPIIKIS